MFGFFSSTDSGEEFEEETGETLIHQVVRSKTEKQVQEINDWIRRVNHEGWDVYILPEDPSINQIRTIDNDLQRLYYKISENRPCDREERMKVMNARQAVQELLEMYIVYESISHPVDDLDVESEDKGGVASASV